MKLHTCLGLFIGLTAVAGWADSWGTGGSQPGPVTAGATWEQQPDGSDSPGLIDDYIRDTRWEIRRRLEVETHFGTANSGDNGLNREGSARVFITGTDTSAIDGLEDEDDVAALKSPGPYIGSSQSNAARTLVTTPTGWGQPLGTGRLLISLNGPTAQVADPTATTDDDGKLYYHTGGAWLEAKAQHDDVSELSRQKSGAANLLPCGSWECETTATTQASFPLASGWVLTNTPTVAVTNHIAASAEGDGLYLSTVSNAVDEGISFTFSGLKPNTIYYATVRARASAGDACSMRTTGDSTNLLATTAATGAFETLRGTFTVNGTPSDTVFILESDGTSDVCDWDQGAVYEQAEANIPTPATVIKHVGFTTQTALGPALATYITTSVTVPGNNYVIQATGVLCAGLNPGLNTTAHLYGALNQNGSAVRYNSSAAYAPVGPEDYFNVTLDYVNLNPTPGTTYTYDLQAAEAIQNLDLNYNGAAFGTRECESSLTVRMDRTN